MTLLERKHFIDELRYDDYFWSVMDEYNSLYDKVDDILEQSHYDAHSRLLVALYEGIRQLKTVVD